MSTIVIDTRITRTTTAEGVLIEARAFLPDGREMPATLVRCSVSFDEARNLADYHGKRGMQEIENGVRSISERLAYARLPSAEVFTIA
ncbi:MAG: hypothetical protein SF187_28990 [Deltaproteobacteria bacterium]|nr:hypothetical protein [Deltaproteobacteria bacterium]